MKDITVYISLILFATMGCKNKIESSQGADFISKVDSNSREREVFQYDFFDREKSPLTEHFQLLPSGEIKPKGWIKEIMKEDLNNGFVGELDNLAPDIMKGDDLFNTNRRQNPNDIPDVGDQVLTGADWEISMQWWSGESLGVWWDGFVRTAFLVDDQNAMQRSREIVDYMMSTMDQDGYFGIYAPSMRYQHTGSNGELWTKTTVFRMMLGFYELTKDQKVLDFVEKAMANTMKYYNKDAKSPFNVALDYGGVTHGLMMTDVCEMLYRITGNVKYRDYGVFLYEDFSEYPINRSFNDACYGYLMQKDSLFESHSAHTYEHLRSVINAYYATGYPELGEAYKSSLNKLSFCVLPSGAGFGNEWLNKEKANPSTTGAEVCGINELKDFFLSALQKTGDVAFADAAEKISFNGLLGTRNKEGSGITYCKTDNCYILNRKAPQFNFEEYDPRYKYSPTHADAAVCCNPSYSRYFPYYVSNMWMKTKDGIAAVLYGPSQVNTSFNGVDISIEQITDYPLGDNVKFKISVSEPISLPIYFRKPLWSKAIIFNGVEAELMDGYYKVDQKWDYENNSFEISFENDLQMKEFHNGEWYLQRGSIVYAYKIPFRTETVKEYEVEGFRDYYVFAEDKSYENLVFTSKDIKDLKLEIDKASTSSKENSWYNDTLNMKVEIGNSATKNKERITLVPMGATVLRRVTFPFNNNI